MRRLVLAFAVTMAGSFCAVAADQVAKSPPDGALAGWSWRAVTAIPEMALEAFPSVEETC